MKSLYLQVAIDAVKRAEAKIMRYYQSDLTVSNKQDDTPVTIADREAEESIKAVIHAAFPDHTFFGEEGEKSDLSNHKGFTWIIDPIDGTSSYLRGIPLFGTLLALLHDGEIEVGVSNAPAWGELMWAAKGEGAFVNGKPARVSRVTDIHDAYVSNGRLKYFEIISKMTPLLDIARQAKWARGIGDFWIYHLVAQGKVDIMMEGYVNFWDVAAPKIIVEEAGGKFTQLNGKPIGYSSTSCLATNGLLHRAVEDAMGD
jgi:histidinol-phosphatase